MSRIGREVRDLREKLSQARHQEKVQKKKDKMLHKESLKSKNERKRIDERQLKSHKKLERALKKRLKVKEVGEGKQEKKSKEDRKEKERKIKENESLEFLPYTFVSAYLPIRQIKKEIQTMGTKDYDKIKKMQIDYLIDNLKSAEEVFK